MKPTNFKCTGFARTLSLIILIGLGSLSTSNAAPLPSSFGVWDRGGPMDPKVYPYVRGTGCDAPWDEVEKTPGVYDWSVMDQAVERAYKDKISLYFSFEAGPKTPGWVYEKGVPKVVTDNERHAGKFPHYPYYLSPEYKMYYHRFITEVAKHIRSYPKDRQERIAFIHVKTGCTGDETPYKGKALDPKYDLPKSSADWRSFRLETFALYAKLFDQVEPKISLLFGGITGDDDNGGEGKNPEEWKWVTSNIGGPIMPTSSIYSRFARGFEHSSGKDALYFKLHDGFSQDATPKVMSITVVWYDGQEGSTWKLDYDAGTPTMKTGLTVTGKGDKQWHHEVVTLRDAVFRHGGIKGADLALVNTDAKDDIFSLIEVHRGEPELPALRPPAEVRAFTGYGKGTKYGKGENGEKSKKDKKDKKTR
jgi:hypothetical protein